MTEEQSNNLDSPIIKRTPNSSSKEQLIKVCVRLKPALNDQRSFNEEENNDYFDESYQNQRSYGNCWQISEGKHLLNLKTKDQFSFDRVYTPNMTTQEVFSRDIRELVSSSMDGFNATVFAYGQTSSGKTYTMRGNDSSPGLIPYSIFELFKIASQLHPAKLFDIEISYVEIYNEQLRDLLPKNCEQSFDEIQKSSSAARRKSISLGASQNRGLDIRESVKNGIFIKGLCKHRVTSIEETLDKLQQGDRNRTFAETKLNTRSSRSHTIFRVHIKSYDNPEEDQQLQQNISNDNSFNTSSILKKSKYKQSILSLVDLAGSQGVNKTHTEGLRFRECSNINKSLLALSNVIHKLSQKSAATADNAVGSISSSNNLSNVFINFRDSKLTRILQPSLQGQSKTCIICLISQDTKNYQQTLNTLKFGFKAMSIKPFVRINQMNIFTDHNLYSHAISNGKLREALLEIEGLRHAMGVKDQKIEKLTNTTKKQEKQLFLQQQQNQRMAFMNRQDDTDDQNISSSNAGALLFPDDSVSNNSIAEEEAVLGRISRIPPLNTGNALMFQNSMNSSRSSRVKDEKSKRASFMHKRQTSQDVSSPSSKSNRYRPCNQGFDPNSRYITQNSLPPQYQSQWSGIPTPSKQQIISPFNLSQKDVGDDISPNYFGIQYQTQQLRGRVQQLEKEISKKEQDLRHALQISSYLQSEIESTFQANKILQGENQDLRQEQTQLMEIIQSAQKNQGLVKTLTKQNCQLKQKLGLLKRQQIAETRASCQQPEIIDLSSDESQKNRYEDELKQMHEKLQKQKIAYDQLTQHASDLQQMKNELQSNLHAVQKNFQMLKNEYSSVNNQLQLSKAQNDRAEKSIKFFMNESVQLKNDLNFYKKEIKIVSNAAGSNGGEYLAEEKRKMQDSYQGKVKALKNERNHLKDVIQKLNLEVNGMKQMQENCNKSSTCVSVQIQTQKFTAELHQQEQLQEGEARMDIEIPSTGIEQQFDDQILSEQIKQESIDSEAVAANNSQAEDQQQKLLRPRSNTKIPPLLACYPILVHKRKGNAASWDRVLDQRSKSLKIQAHHSLQMANKLHGIFIQLLDHSGGVNRFSKLSQSYQSNFEMINNLMSDVILDSDTIRYIIENQLPPPNTTPFDVSQALLTQQANSQVNNTASIVAAGEGAISTGKRTSLRNKRKKKKTPSPQQQFQSPKTFSNEKQQQLLQQQQQQSYSSMRRSKRLLGENPDCQVSQFS